MEDPKYSDELYINIIKTYLDTESVKDTARELKTTPVKVRKVLITEGLWSSKTSLEVQHFLNLGMTTAQIAEKLSTTEKAVQQYLPYSKGVYRSDNPSLAALNSADYRERIRVAREKTIKQTQAVKNQWEENKEMDKMSREEPWMRLHLELERDDGESERIKAEAEKVTEVLRTYGDVKYGDTISRDIIVPGSMPLWALNYVIQKCFGWQNSHLHRFELPDDQFRKICDGESRKFIDLVGVVFRSPWMDEEEQFWTDDYENGSFKTWLRKKYTGPYESMCHGEGIWQCKQDVKEIRKRYEYASVVRNSEGHYNWPKAITKKEYEELKENKSQEVFTFDEIPFDAMRWMFESSMNCILERLSVQEVFANGVECFDDIMNRDVRGEVDKCQELDLPDYQPVIGGLSEMLLYEYDFGDGWCVRITSSDVDDLIETERITEEDLSEAVAKLHETYRPVCIAQDGRMVLDDVGGIGGYVQFLRGINQKGHKEDRDEDDWSEEYGMYADKEGSLEWAKSLGWSKRRISNKNML